jgi:hypothetical protein
MVHSCHMHTPKLQMSACSSNTGSTCRHMCN